VTEGGAGGMMMSLVAATMLPEAFERYVLTVKKTIKEGASTMMLTAMTAYAFDDIDPCCKRRSGDTY
jgi:hypothetical protein